MELLFVVLLLCAIEALLADASLLAGVELELIAPLAVELFAATLEVFVLLASIETLAPAGGAEA